MISYRALKQSVRLVAEACVEEASGGAAHLAPNDPYGLIMSDKNDARQTVFLLKITGILTVDERQVLLNGLAQEYSDAADWLDYCAVDEPTRHDRRREQDRARGRLD